MSGTADLRIRSLIELLIVVAIILIIAAIATPNLIRSKMATNEASAVASLHTYDRRSAFSTTHGTDPTALLNLGPGTSPSSTSADLVDNLLGAATPTKSGYLFSFSAGTAPSGTSVISTYTINANPQSTSTGQRYFYTDQTGVMRYTTNGNPATAINGPIG